MPEEKIPKILSDIGDSSDDSDSLIKFLGPEKAAELQRNYIRDVVSKLDTLINSVKQKDMMEIRRIAHQLRGSGKSYGFNYISEAGTELSKFAKNMDFGGLNNVIHELATYLKKKEALI